MYLLPRLYIRDHFDRRFYRFEWFNFVYKTRKIIPINFSEWDKREYEVILSQRKQIEELISRNRKFIKTEVKKKKELIKNGNIAKSLIKNKLIYSVCYNHYKIKVGYRQYLTFTEIYIFKHVIHIIDFDNEFSFKQLIKLVGKDILKRIIGR